MSHLGYAAFVVAVISRSDGSMLRMWGVACSTLEQVICIIYSRRVRNYKDDVLVAAKLCGKLGCHS